jgi:hypothetical protein
MLTLVNVLNALLNRLQRYNELFLISSRYSFGLVTVRDQKVLVDLLVGKKDNYARGT